MKNLDINIDQNTISFEISNFGFIDKLKIVWAIIKGKRIVFSGKINFNYKTSEEKSK